MQWTEEQYQELSRKVAEKFNLSGYINQENFPAGFGSSKGGSGWIHNDWHTIMELCVKYHVFAYHGNAITGEFPYNSIEVYCFHPKEISILVDYSDHNNDQSLAERVARCLALLEVEI